MITIYRQLPSCEYRRYTCDVCLLQHFSGWSCSSCSISLFSSVEINNTFLNATFSEVVGLLVSSDLGYLAYCSVNRSRLTLELKRSELLEFYNATQTVRVVERTAEMFESKPLSSLIFRMLTVVFLGRIAVQSKDAAYCYC